MKKIIFISLLFICLFPSKINAETYTGSASISLSYDIAPSYSVKMPKTIDISNNSTTFFYYVSGDIYADQTLQVLFDNEAYISNANNSCKVLISQSKTNFASYEINNSYSQHYGIISHQTLDSGKWFGVLNVVISLIGGA